MHYFRKYIKQNIYNSILYIFLLGLISTIFLNCSTDRTSGQDITYNTHIRPILSDKCFKCHGPDANKRKSGYRLDTEEGAFAALKDHKD